MAGADTIERLQLFLRELSPQARSMLIAEFERTLLRGEELGDADLRAGPGNLHRTISGISA